MPDILAAYTWLTGRDRAAAAVVARLPPVPLVPTTRRTRSRRWPSGTATAAIPCDVLWLDIEHMDGYRVFTWDARTFPDVGGMLAPAARDAGFRLVTIVDPGVKHEPGYAVFDEAVERDVLCRTEGGDLYIGQVWPGDTAFPDFVTEEARAWWGELNAAHVGPGSPASGTT